MLDIKVSPSPQRLVDELEGMEEGFGEKGLRAGLVQGIKPVKARMKALAPEHRGHLKQAIGHVSVSKRAKQRLGIKADTAAILAGANRKITINGRKYWQGKKAHWLETGTKYMRARPFIAPAAAQTDSDFESRFYKGLISYVERQRAKRRTR